MTHVLWSLDGVGKVGAGGMTAKLRGHGVAVRVLVRLAHAHTANWHAIRPHHVDRRRFRRTGLMPTIVPLWGTECSCGATRYWHATAHHVTARVAIGEATGAARAGSEGAVRKVRHGRAHVAAAAASPILATSLMPSIGRTVLLLTPPAAALLVRHPDPNPRPRPHTPRGTIGTQGLWDVASRPAPS